MAIGSAMFAACQNVDTFLVRILVKPTTSIKLTVYRLEESLTRLAILGGTLPSKSLSRTSPAW